MPTTSTPADNPPAASVAPSPSSAPGRVVVAPRIPGRTDVREMFVVHTAFRRDFRLAPGLVRAVADGDTARARLVGEHLTMVTEMLHHHHTGEDELLWPLLLERVPEQLAPIVELMEAQHARVAELQGQFPDVCAAFTAHPGAETRERLAVLFDDLYRILDEHLAAEEQRLLPIAANYVSQQEWARLGQRGADVTFGQKLLMFGSLMYQGDPEVVAEILAQVPWPVRSVLPALSRRAFARRAREIYGTPTP